MFQMHPYDTTRLAFITLSSKAKDITGQRFGRLVALGPVGKSKTGLVVWLCRCDCGKAHTGIGTNLSYGHTRSCGCLSKDVTTEIKTTHGFSHTKIYAIWGDMITRCTNQKARGFSTYGGRGISVCLEWRASFESFYEHVSSIEHFGEEGYTLDRIDSNGDYVSGNVRWATYSQQNRNRRDNHLLTFLGKTQCLQAWAEELGIKRTTILMRLRRGWEVERALVR